MKNSALVLIALIGLYTFGRNNLGVLPPGQVVWVSHPDIIYKLFIPLLMLASAISAFIKKSNINFFYLSFTAMFIDAVNRFASLTNYYYMFLTYDQPTNYGPATGNVVIKTNYISSVIILFIEIVMVVSIFKYFYNHRNIKLKMNS